MRCRILAILATISLGLVGGASAADMTPVYKAPPAPPPVVDPWTGFYVGVNGGYSWGPWDSSSVAPIFPGPVGFSGTASPKVNGGLGGIQGGYNWRLDNRWVAGLEADFQGTGERATTTAASNLFILVGVTLLQINTTKNDEWKFPWFATFRGRIGALIDPTTLIYLTGGLAVGRFEFSTLTTVTVTGGGGPPSAVSAGFSESTTRLGGAVGAGVEKKFTPKWSAKAEFLYLDFGSHVFLGGTGVDTNVRLHDYVARVGLNYSFN